jgi:hypothetical protein
METITSTIRLKNAIQLLEDEQAAKWQLLKEQINITYTSFKPINFLANSFNNLASSPYLIENILGTTVGLATGYLSKKIVVGASVNIFRKLLGSVMQLGVTNMVTRHPDALKSFGRLVLQHFLRRKAIRSKKNNVNLHERASSRTL